MNRNQRRKPTPSKKSSWVLKSNKPKVRINGKQLDVLTRQTVEILKSEPALYCFAGLPARFECDEQGNPGIRPFNKSSLLTQMSLVADFVRVDGRGKQVAATPPREVAEAILTLPASYYPFRSLKAIVRSPIVRADGSILRSPGYDDRTQLIYEPPAGVRIPRIPLRPSPGQLGEAVELIQDLVSDFPFADQSSRANFLGMLVSPFTRYLAPGPRPLALLEAHVAGTGKTLLMQMWSIIATGRPADLYSPPAENAEWRKQITSILRGTPMLICWDNLDSVLQSGELAKFLTADMWADRELGVNKALQLPVLCDCAITGNNIQLGGDMPRRCYRILLDAGLEKPHLRTNFKYPNIKSHVLDNRATLIAALITMIRAWVVAGKPAPHTPTLGSFENWSYTVGGILQHAGVNGFLENLHQVLEDADPELREAEAWFKFLADHFGGRPFSTSEVYNYLREASGQNRKALDFVPNDLQEVVKHDGKFQMKLGWMFRKHTARPLGPDGLRILKTGARRGANLWRFATGSGAKCECARPWAVTNAA